MERIVVLRYAKALFEIALERGAGVLDEYNQTCKDILALLEGDAEFAAVVNHLSISADDKMATMKAIFEGKVADDFMGIFALIFRRGRQGELAGILEHFGKLYKSHKRIATAKLMSAAPLPQSKIDEIAAMLTKKLEKTVEFNITVDPTLIAGFRVEVDGYVFDASMKAGLSQLKKQLLSAGRHTVLQ
ncbi:MAG: ATP synthase F1 subunit delta [Defluviitaleaceae bacterium]|nr:ATP synthase F1 subunit delta [Defluviitaleaceae bacterium]